MMAKPSAFAMKMQAKQAAEINYHRKFTTQWCEDAAILAANEVFQRRGDKLVEFRDAYRRWADDIARMTIDDAKGDRSLEYTKDRLDARLREILGDAFESWDDYNSVAVGDFVTHWMPLPEPPKGE